MELSTPAPCGPVLRTCSTPSVLSLTMPRWYSVRPGFLRMASALRARSSGSGAARAPIMRSSAGRTKARKVTITATGLPGRPNSTAPLLSFE